MATDDATNNSFFAASSIADRDGLEHIDDDDDVAGVPGC